MPAQTLRNLARDPHEPVSLDLTPVRFAGHSLTIRLILRFADDRVWRGRLEFTDAASQITRETAEIFCSASEQDLWDSVRGLREHHLRDLYRSLE
ncbi:MAG TPA: hypothetical protein VFO06_11600 [Gemmatimonadales bacterium]|nr:hypothetical protein [Gemmatimonadales bacterium]